MMRRSNITWTQYRGRFGAMVLGYTFNPWHGCVKVSPGCDHCYAEAITQRFSKVAIWGKYAGRKLASEEHWAGPLALERRAIQEGTRPKIFVASMSDLFERHGEVTEARLRLFGLIQQTPHLDWLLLTKRIGNVLGMVPYDWEHGDWPLNAWLGTSIENQQWANIRVPLLLRTPAPIRFLSCEPLLGPINLTEAALARGLDYYAPEMQSAMERTDALYPLHWVIAGGESGANARSPEEAWFTDLRRQCRHAAYARIPFFFKQWGGATHAAGGDLLQGLTYQDAPIPPALAALAGPLFQ